MNATVRLAAPDDDNEMLAIYAPVVRKTAVSFEIKPPSKSDFLRRIEQTLEQNPWLVAEADREILGFAYASPHRKRAAYQWSVESSVYVRSDQRRRGVASVLYSSLCAILALQGYYTVYAGTVLPNEASVALHKSFGFQPVGTYHSVGYKLGKWHDVKWWELPLRQRENDEPNPPRPVAETRGEPAYAKAIAKGSDSLKRKI